MTSGARRPSRVGAEGAVVTQRGPVRLFGLRLSMRAARAIVRAWNKRGDKDLGRVIEEIVERWAARRR